MEVEIRSEPFTVCCGDGRAVERVSYGVLWSPVVRLWCLQIAL